MIVRSLPTRKLSGTTSASSVQKHFWQMTFARNLYYRKLESRQRSDSFDENSQMDEALIDQVEFIYRQQKRELLFSLFAKLPLSQRELAIEYYISGIPRDAICRSRNISKSVFDSRLLRMRNKIRKYLRKSHSNRQEIVFINRFHELLKGDYAMDEFRIEISRTLVPELIEQDENLMSFIKNQRQRFRKDFNGEIPKIHISDSEFLRKDEFIILRREQRIKEGKLKERDKLKGISDIISETFMELYQ